MNKSPTPETSPSSGSNSPPPSKTSPPPQSKTPPSLPTKAPSTPPPTNTPSPPPATKTPSQPPPTKTPSPPSPSTGTPSSPSPPSQTSPSPPAPTTPEGETSPRSAGGKPTPSSPLNPSPPSLPSGQNSGRGSRSGSSSRNADGGGGSSTGVAAGVTVASVVILVVLSMICVYCIKKRKRRRDEYGGEGGYYISPLPPHHQSSVGPKDGYGVQAQRWQQSYALQANQYQKSKPPLTPATPLPLKSPSPLPSPLPAPAPFTSSGGGSESGSEKSLPPPPPVFGFSNSTFTYEELAMATDGFADSNLLGQGGFGYVHRGVLANGKEVAVKALKAGSGQGEREFQAEVEIITRVHHKHLVTLVGYCITGSHRLLVYEFVPNHTMEFHLHGQGQPTMDWATRLKIALGSAKGLAYLHEDCHPKIIHRDIKSANILLDYKFEAKVADFGLAKISSDLHTHISTRVMGTFGYLAPEYASSGKLTDKSDVFSFGVVLLQLITGRKPVDSTNTYMDDSLVEWARPQLTKVLEENNFDSLVDPRLQNNFNPNEMTRMVACAAACVRHAARRRPRMSQVVRALEGEVSLSDLNDGMQPGQSSIYGSHGSADYDGDQYKEDMKKFRKMALAGQESSSSEDGGTTSESGMYPSGSSNENQTEEMEMGKTKTDSGSFS